MRLSAGVIRQCKGSHSGCNNDAIAASVSDLLLTEGPVVGAAFPTLGLAISIVGSLGLLFLSLAYIPSSQISKGILPSAIQAALEQELLNFQSNADQSVANSFAIFRPTDIDNFVRLSRSLGYILKQDKLEAR